MCREEKKVFIYHIVSYLEWLIALLLLGDSK